MYLKVRSFWKTTFVSYSVHIAFNCYLYLLSTMSQNIYLLISVARWDSWKGRVQRLGVSVYFTHGAVAFIMC